MARSRTKALPAPEGSPSCLRLSWKDDVREELGLPRASGTLVLFGQSSGPVSPFDPEILASKGSLFLTRPSLAHYRATRDELLARAPKVS
jgi:NADPH2:quinone reductase